MTHWKKTFNKDWIGAFILPSSGLPDNGDRESKTPPKDNPYGTIVATLIKVEVKTVKVSGRSSENRIAYFAKNPHFDKPMLINQAVNLRRLSKLTGTFNIEDWKNLNLQVTLRAEWSKIPSGGYDWALRIAPSAPKKPKLTPDSEKWGDAVKALASGNVTIDQIKANYELSGKDERAIQDQSKSGE